MGPDPPATGRTDAGNEDLQEDQETFDPTTLSCEVHEVSVDAVIDYTDKHGNETRREITTEEIYDYEDGVVVIRAFCHSRRDYRTFVSKRVRYWVEPNSGKPVDVGNIGEYLIKVSRRDIPNFGNEPHCRCELGNLSSSSISANSASVIKPLTLD